MRKGFSCVATEPVRGAHLAADITGIHFVHHIAEGSKFVLSVSTVYTIVDRNKADVPIREVGISIITHLQIVSAQAGHILDDQHRHISQIHIFQQFLKAGAIEVGAGIAIVHIVAGVAKAMLFCVFL